MTVTKDQAQMLATLVCAARPVGARQWKPEAVMAELAKFTDRNLGAVICAVTRCAMDRNVQRPEAIVSAGSHWGDTAVSQPFVPQTMTSDQRCSICSLSEPACRIRFGADHEFKSAAMAAKEAADVDARAKVQAIRGELEPTAGPTQRRTLEDMAEANPELHARLEQVRQNVALKEIPMQESEQDQPEEAAE
jgi:hypothetical protein